MTAEPPVTNPPPETTTDERGAARQPAPVTSLSDPRAVQILSTEHWSLLAGRSLAYNEAFIRGGMFLTFLSFSFVGLALLAQAMAFSNQFLVVSAVVLAFDFVIGLLTYVRMNGAAVDDLRSLHGMARIRHGYGEIAPVVLPYFTTATHDDIESVITAYGSGPQSTAGELLYGVSTSQGMIGLITTMVGGVLVAIIALALGFGGGIAIGLGAVSAVAILVTIVLLTLRAIPRSWAALEVRFPAPATQSPPERSSE